MMQKAIIAKQELTFIGTGSAFTTGDGNWQSNLLLTNHYMEDVPPSRLLIDCGGDVRHGLAELGLNFNDIDGVYISHLHADHIGGLEGLAFTTYFTPDKDKPYLFVHRTLVDSLWSDSLRGGLASLEGDPANLSTFFHVGAIESKFNAGNQEIEVVQTVHVMNGKMINPSFGLLWTTPTGEKVFFSSDTQFAPNQIMKFYEWADVIFHDCETTPFESGVHSHYDKMRTLPEKVKAKMWLYHYAPGKLPDAVSDGFLGFAKKGQVFKWTRAIVKK